MRKLCNRPNSGYTGKHANDCYESRIAELERINESRIAELERILKGKTFVTDDESLEGLRRRMLCSIRIVGRIDDCDVIRRDSVIDIFDRTRAAHEALAISSEFVPLDTEGRPVKSTDKGAATPTAWECRCADCQRRAVASSKGAALL